ncbi:MAG: tRNA (N(6)-L-threonylcarbamoyladenosine(37)-C(2))-methylthiotransferase MtaB [Anaerolineaceae bacterium]|nr:tRNA (N(6)-L-threonylcarbamoyladenosine(37)-C(2))-methylthiotransferase MtaB [Anaerolineaceae bacterium]
MKIFLDMVGCRLNQSEIESMANKLRILGHQIIASDTEADLVIINTCCVTAKASADSRKMIRHASKSNEKQIIVTGCWATMFRDEAKKLPMVSSVVSNPQKNELISDLFGRTGIETPIGETNVREALPGERHRTRAFIKVQDGCDNHCTFCITCLARGRSRSVSFDVIKSDIQSAIRGNVHEIVLTGVQLGAYGYDQSPRSGLKGLIHEISKFAPEVRIRLSSVEPWDIEESFFDLWKSDNLCRHLHIPIQSGSTKILQKMGRRLSPDQFKVLLQKALESIPGLAVTTDVIVGFPGEGDDEFIETINFIKDNQFAGGHVFTYSAMPGTPAAKFPDQVDHIVRKERNKIMRQIFFKKVKLFNEQSIGETHQVLWETAKQEGGFWKLSGLSDNYLRVISHSEKPRNNTIDNVLITRIETSGDKVWGVINNG